MPVRHKRHKRIEGSPPAKRRWFRILLLWLFVGIVSTVPRAEEGLLVDIKRPIGPAVESFILRAFEETEVSQAPFILLRIDTPGGLVSSIRGIKV
jgi:membrane-bound serine protease (ClpP class)